MNIPKEQEINARAGIIVLYSLSITCSLGYLLSIVTANPSYIAILAENPMGWATSTAWLFSMLVAVLLPFMKVPSDFSAPTISSIIRCVGSIGCAALAVTLLMFGPVLTMIGSEAETPSAVTALLTAGSASLTVLMGVLLAVILIRRRNALQRVAQTA